MPAWNEPAPDTFSQTWNASDEPITPCACSSSPASLCPTRLDLDGDAGALTAGRVELPEEPATRHEEREHEDGEDADDRPRAASAAGPVGADPARCRRAGVPPVASTPWDRFGGRFGIGADRRLGGS